VKTRGLLVAVAAAAWSSSFAAAALGGGVPSPTPFLVADVNCDGRSSSADFSAAVIVSGDGTNFRDCPDANPFRDRALDERDFLPMQHDLFGTFNAPHTPTPTVTATATRTGVATSTATPTPSPSPTDSPTAVPTPTATATAEPPATATPTSTHTATATPPPPPTSTPTGLAQQISGTWFANWRNEVCFLAGQPFTSLQDVSYRVTAVGGRVDIQIVDGAFIGRGLPVAPDGSVRALQRQPSGMFCFGVEQEFDFNYLFEFRTNGTGSATANWTFGFNANCAVCEVNDRATLQRTDQSSVISDQ
jgi:hypothetical protein